MPEPFLEGDLSRIHGQGSTEKLILYDPGMSIAPHVYDKDRRYAVLVVDMLPHHHAEYQQQMGHVWLGFAEHQITRFLTGAGFDQVRLRALPVDPDAKGPALFAAVATKPLA